jgi:predicted transcriptional regulator
MQRVQLHLGDDLAAQIRAIARQEHRSIAAVIRDGLSDWIERRARPDAFDRARTAIGSAHSGLGDLAEKHDLYLAAGDLVSVSDVARRSGRPVSTVQSWRRRYLSFPQPIAKLSARPVWDWDEVKRWTRRHAAGETRRRSWKPAPWPADLPGADLVSAGLADLAAGRRTMEAALVSLATTRLHSLGVELPAAPLENASDRLYELVDKRVGEAGAHSRYNALRRRLSSFLRALALANAQAG